MESMFVVVSALFGLIIGSFLNVVVARHGTGMGLRGRSKCFSCGTTLAALELVPVASYVMQRGKCAHCKSRISARYALVELAAAALFAGVAWMTPYPETALSVAAFIAALAFWSVMLAIVAYDLRHMTIPDSFSIALGVVGLAALALRHAHQPASALIPDLLGGFGMALFFFALWAFTRGKGMGLGDSKIAFGTGWFLGLVGAVDALFFSFWIGAIFGIVFLALGKRVRSDNALFGARLRVTMKTEVPFAPFLAAAAALSYFANVHLPFFF